MARAPYGTETGGWHQPVSLSLLESKASAALRRRAGLVSGEASADLNLVNASAKRDFNTPRTNLGERFGADSTLSASGMLGAHAEGKGEFQNGLSGALRHLQAPKPGQKPKVHWSGSGRMTTAMFFGITSAISPAPGTINSSIKSQTNGSTRAPNCSLAQAEPALPQALWVQMLDWDSVESSQDMPVSQRTD